MLYSKQDNSLGMSESFALSDTFKHVFSIICALLIVAHGLFPDLTVDTTTVWLLALLLAPYILPLIAEIVLPGGTKVKMKDSISENIEEVKEKAEADDIKIELGEITQLGSDIVKTSSVDQFYTVTDPNISVAAFRIDFERAIRKLASLLNIQDNSLSKMIDSISTFLGWDEKIPWFLKELYQIGNRAVHGEQLNLEDATYLLDRGKVVMKYLESEIAVQETKQDLG